MAGVRRGTFTCVGWHVTLYCDPILHVTSRSSEVGFPQASYMYIGLYLYRPFVTIKALSTLKTTVADFGDCRRIRRLSPKTTTVAKNGDCPYLVYLQVLVILLQWILWSQTTCHWSLFLRSVWNIVQNCRSMFQTFSSRLAIMESWLPVVVTSLWLFQPNNHSNRYVHSVATVNYYSSMF